MGNATRNAAAKTATTSRGTDSVEKRVKDLEARLNKLLSGKTVLEVKDVKGLTVAPRSKLRVSCE